MGGEGSREGGGDGGGGGGSDNWREEQSCVTKTEAMRSRLPDDPKTGMEWGGGGGRGWELGTDGGNNTHTIVPTQLPLHCCRAGGAETETERSALRDPRDTVPSVSVNATGGGSLPCSVNSWHSKPTHLVQRLRLSADAQRKSKSVDETTCKLPQRDAELCNNTALSLGAFLSHGQTQIAASAVRGGERARCERWQRFNVRSARAQEDWRPCRLTPELTGHQLCVH